MLIIVWIRLLKRCGNRGRVKTIGVVFGVCISCLVFGVWYFDVPCLVFCVSFFVSVIDSKEISQRLLGIRLDRTTRAQRDRYPGKP